MNTSMLIGSMYVFYLLFIVTMATKAAWWKLSVFARILLAPAGLLAVVMDVAFNITLASIFFLDMPEEWLFTGRLNRYETTGTAWRTLSARWICRNLLDPFQSGGHCRG